MADEKIKIVITCFRKRRSLFTKVIGIGRKPPCRGGTDGRRAHATLSIGDVYQMVKSFSANQGQSQQETKKAGQPTPPGLFYVSTSAPAIQ